jgi:large subunit ribosomal protein L23
MNLVIYPRISERSYAQAGEFNIYTFNVPLKANKLEIKQAVEKLYSVKVDTVNIARITGKTKQSYKKRGKKVTGKRSDYKKAYVKLTKGQTIPTFIPEEGEK